MKKIVAAALASTALVAFAPAAQADEYHFLDRLGDYSIGISDVSTIIELGYSVCNALDAGYSSVAIAHTIWQESGAAFDHDDRALTLDQSGAFVGLSRQELC